MSRKNTFIKVKTIILWASLSVFLSACGSGGESTPPATTNNSVTGVFVDAAVSGVDYVCSSGASGVTNALGEFTCETGDTVTFSIAGINLGTVMASAIITPTTLFPSDPAAALNVAQLLQTLDSDGDPSNGITPKADLLESLKDTTIDFTSSSFDTDVQTTLGTSVTLVTETAAQDHLNDTFAELDINSDGTENTSNFSVGGLVTGLSGTGLVLQNNNGNNLAITSDGSFVFTIELNDTSTYSVSVLNNPTSANQTCLVTHAGGTLSGANISDVIINCDTNKYNVSVTVNGLTGSGLVLQNNNGDNLTVTANGTATFSNPIADLSAYAVSINSSPLLPSQSCSIINAAGNINGVDSTATIVNCVVNTFSIGGQVSGLSGLGLVLQNNNGDNLAISSNGSFTFNATSNELQNYNVTVLTNATNPNQQCTVSNGAGAVGTSNVTHVAISCATLYTVSGNVSGLLGTGLILQNNNGDNLAISNDGSFTFANSIVSGNAYAVTVLSHATSPSQTCSVTNSSGTLSNENIDTVVVSCIASYSVGGTVTGLQGSGVVLQNNFGDDITISSDGSYVFNASLDVSDAYSVSLKTNTTSPSQTCTLSNASGTIGSSNITNVSLSCITDSFTIGGTVTGLTGSGLVLQNNNDEDLSIANDGSFTFATSHIDLSSYSVSVLQLPQSVNQSCVISNSSGSLSGANVSNMVVSCIDDIAPQVVGISPSSKAWNQNPTKLQSDDVNKVYAQQIATDNTGNAMAVWNQKNGTHSDIIAKRYLADGTWESEVVISNGVNNAFNMKIGFNNQSKAIAIWEQEDSAISRNELWSNIFDPATGWAGPQRLDNVVTDFIRNSRIAASPTAINADAFVVWDYKNKIYSVKYDASTSTWNTPTQISSISGPAVREPQISISPISNKAMAVWVELSAIDRVVSKVFDGTNWGNSTQLLTANIAKDATFPEIKMDKNDDAVAIWRQEDNFVDSIWSNRFVSSTQSWTDLTLLGGNSTNEAYEPQLEMDANGNAIATWFSGISPKVEIMARYYMVGQQWLPAIKLKTRPNQISKYALNDKDVKFDANNNAIVMWGEVGDLAQKEIWSNRYLASSGLWEGAVLAHENTSTISRSVSQPRVAFKPNGDAIVLYRHLFPNTEDVVVDYLVERKVDLASSISATFNESMFAATIGNASFTLNNGSATSATVTYDDATKVATLTPDAALKRLSTYTATLDNSISDLSGNILSPSSWTFTTKDGDWANPELISSGSTGLNSITDAQVNFDKDGNALAIWSQGLSGFSHRDIFTSYYDAASKVWTIPTNDRFGDGNIQNLPLNDTAFGHTALPKVKFDDNGNAVAVWQQLNSGDTKTDLFSNRYIKGSGWQGVGGTTGVSWDPTVTALESGTVNSSTKPELVVAKNGEAMVLYTRNNTLYSNHFYDTGDGIEWFGPVAVTAINSTNPINGHKFGIDSNSNIIAVWAQEVGSDSVARIWVSRYDRVADTWGTSTALTSDSDKVSNIMDLPEISVNANGDAIVVWRRNDPNPGSPDSIRYSIYDAASDSWATETALNDLSLSSDEPKIKLSDSGKAIAIWVEETLGNVLSINSRVYDPSTGWASSVNVLDGMVSFYDHNVEIDAEGNAVVNWSTDDTSPYAVFANRYLVGQGWTGIKILSDLAIGSDYPRLAEDNNGHFVATWLEESSNDLMSTRFE